MCVRGEGLCVSTTVLVLNWENTAMILVKDKVDVGYVFLIEKPSIRDWSNGKKTVVPE